MLNAEAPETGRALSAARRALHANGSVWSLVATDGPAGVGRDLTVVVEGELGSDLDVALAAEGYVRIAASGHPRHRSYAAYDAERDVWTRVRCRPGAAVLPGHEPPIDVGWRHRGAAAIVRRVSRRTGREGADRWKAKRGITLAILGPDGAGKTTLADALVASLPFAVRYVYLGMWRPSRLRESLRHIIGARLAIVLVKLSLKSMLVAYHRRLGRVVVLDRFTYDADVASANLDWKGRLTSRLVKSLCADPDLIVLLDAPADVMFDRKGEHGLEKLQALREGYLRLAERYPELAVVDATQPRDQIRRHVTALLWTRLATSRDTPTAPPSQL
jgi:thymidylate kinase